MSAVRPWPCISTAITFRVLESSPIHWGQLFVMVMNEPWSNTTGFAASVDFVVHFESVDRRVTRSWLLLRRYDSRHEHRQEKSCCLHVSFLAWASVPSSKSNDAPRNRRLASVGRSVESERRCVSNATRPNPPVLRRAACSSFPCRRSCLLRTRRLGRLARHT